MQMLKRLKTALVDSFVGAIAIGWLLAEGIIHFVNVFIEPEISWISQRQYLVLIHPNPGPPPFPFQLALSELLKSLFLLLIAYGLLRWLYYPATEKQDQEQTPNQENGA
jgi:predicted Kef-type K+ transport protein